MSEHTPSPTPSRAVYGFGLLLSFRVLFYVYIIWAIVPENWFRIIGITYLPQRYWAVAVPVFFLTILATFAFVIYPAMGLIITPDWHDIRTIKDSYSANKNANLENIIFMKNIPDGENECCSQKYKCRKLEYEQRDKEEFSKNCIPRLYDLDVVNVSKQLYLN